MAVVESDGNKNGWDSARASTEYELERCVGGDVLGKVKGVRSTSRLGSEFPIGRKFHPVLDADRATPKNSLYTTCCTRFWVNIMSCRR